MFTTRDILKLILPMMLQQILSITFGTVDSLMVSTAGEAAVSGVSLIGSLDGLLTIAFSSLVAGGAVTVSHALGAKDKKLSLDGVKQLYYTSTFIALILTVLVNVFRTPLLMTLFGSAEAEVMSNATDYFKYISLSFPFLSLYSSGASVYRVMGNTTLPMFMSIGMNIVNVIGNTVLIFGFDMGAAGAAISTLASRLMGAIAITVMLHNKNNELYIDRLFSYRPNMRIIKKILRIGVPNGIENSMFQFGRLSTQILISSLGTASIAANSVANTIANYLYMPSVAISDAAITVVGRCVGAKEYKQAKKYSAILLGWTYIAMIILGLFSILIAKPVISAYNISQEGSRIAFELTVFHSIATATIRPLAFTLPAVFKAAGDVKFSMVVSTLSMWFMRVALAFVLTPQSMTLFGFTYNGLGIGIMGVWLAMVADWIVRALAFTVHYFKNKWLTKKSLV